VLYHLHWKTYYLYLVGLVISHKKVILIGVKNCHYLMLNLFGSTAPLMEKNINLIFVGWVKRSETQH
jgi:hypothetical protein